jgi:hypothetical protein
MENMPHVRQLLEQIPALLMARIQKSRIKSTNIIQGFVESILNRIVIQRTGQEEEVQGLLPPASAVLPTNSHTVMQQ